MRLFTPLVLASIIAVAHLHGSEDEKAIEDELDAIVPHKNVQESTKPAEAPKKERPVDPKVEAIVLAPNPSKGDVSKYLMALRDVNGKRPAGAPPANRIITYPILDVKRKLKALPSQYIEEALVYAAKDEGILSFRHAIIDEINSRKSINTSQREAVLQYLPKCPDLIVTVARHGWEKGEEKLILKTLKSVQARDERYTIKQLSCRSIGHYVPVLVEYGTEASQKMVKELLTNRRSAREMRSCFLALPEKDLPWLNRMEIVEKAWEKAKESSGNLSGPDQYAPIASKYGQIDALVFMAKKLNGLPSQRPNSIESETRTEMSMALPTLVPEGGTNEAAIVRYVLANRTKLTYDRDDKTYKMQ